MRSTSDGLCVEKVHVWRGERHVLRGICLSVVPGDLLHVQGPNGSGKTTLLRAATGLLRPEQGGIWWRGEPLHASAERYQQEMAYASHEPALKGDLTALENLRFLVGLRRTVSTGELQSSLERAGVGACADLPARVLSAGQRRRVAMARVLAVRAVVWLLDEPYSHLDDAGLLLMSNLLSEHVAGGGMALVVAHHELHVTVPTREVVLTP